MNKPTIENIADGFQFSWLDLGVQAYVDRFHESGGDITAELKVSSFVPGKKGLLHFARLNLTSSRTRSSLAKSLQERLEGPDWQGLLEQLCLMAVVRYREGEPSIDLRDVDPFAKPRWLYWPYLEYGGPTVLYGEGGHGKSVLALYFALRCGLGAPRGYGQNPSEPIQTLYLDYETSAEIHAQRLHGLLAGMGIDQEASPPIMYRRMHVTLAQSAYNIQKEIDEQHIGLVIIDSLGLAGGGDPKEASTVVTLFNAIRTFPIPVLAVHHKRKSAGFKASRDDMYGSVYYLNFARNVWEIDGVNQEDDCNLTAGMIHVKSNNGRLMPRHAYRISFQNDDMDQIECINLEKVDMTDVPELAGRVPLKTRIRNLLADKGALTTEQIADELNESKTTIGPMLSRMKNKSVVKLPDYKWGLKAFDDESASS